MSPEKPALDNKPVTMNSVSRIPGSIGWGIERQHLKAENKIICDDQINGTQFPIKKNHLIELDKNRTTMFPGFEGSRAAEIDKKLGIDYSVYHAMNKQAQRTTLKLIDGYRKLNATGMQNYNQKSRSNQYSNDLNNNTTSFMSKQSAVDIKSTQVSKEIIILTHCSIFSFLIT